MSKQQDDKQLTLRMLLMAGINESQLWDVDEREAINEKLAASVSERTLHLLIESEATRDLGERLQEALLDGSDLLQVAANNGMAQEDAFAEAFSAALAAVLDEVVELSEADDATELRKRLHDAIATAMRDSVL